MRNTRVVDVIEELRDYGVSVKVYDPCADPAEAKAIYGIDLIDAPQDGAFDGVVVAVAHDAFAKGDPEDIRKLCKSPGVIYDLKHILPKRLLICGCRRCLHLAAYLSFSRIFVRTRHLPAGVATYSKGR